LVDARRAHLFGAAWPRDLRRHLGLRARAPSLRAELSRGTDGGARRYFAWTVRFLGDESADTTASLALLEHHGADLVATNSHAARRVAIFARSSSRVRRSF